MNVAAEVLAPIDSARSAVSNWQVIRRLMRYLRPFNGYMLISLTARIIKLVSQAAVLGIAAASVGIYVENSQAGVVNWGVIWGQVKWIGLAGTTVGVMSYIEHYTGHYVAFRILASLRDRFYYAMLPLAPAKTGQLQSGDAVSRVMVDCERVEPFYAHTIAPAVSAILVPVLLLAWCWTVHPSLAWKLAPIYAATTFLLPWLVARLGGDGVRYREKLGQVNAFVADSIQGVRDTVAFGYEGRRAQELWNIGASMQEGQDRLYGADATQRALAEIFITIGILAAAWWGIELSRSGEISASVQLPALIAVSVVGFYASVGLANNYTDYRVSLIAARRLFSLMDQPPAVREVENPTRPTSLIPAVTFDSVSFEYEGSDGSWSRGGKVFDGLSLEIPAGSNVALVGPSGSGKSTLVNLLLRHWEPQQGSIRIGGVPIRELALEQLQELIAVVSQRTYIFNESVADNIRMGRIDADRESIEEAGRRAGLAQWAAEAVRGYETPAGERGGKLSGGQRQRVAIARAVLKDSPIVLLDEATSNLDVETEASVMGALRDLCVDRTTLVIAHRLATVVECDEIMVMKNGRIVERGRHTDLMASGGWYARMFEIQQDEVDVTIGTESA